MWGCLAPTPISLLTALAFQFIAWLVVPATPVAGVLQV